MSDSLFMTFTKDETKLLLTAAKLLHDDWTYEGVSEGVEKLEPVIEKLTRLVEKDNPKKNKREPSQQQTVDVWETELANDPAKW